ncbi:MAG: elongation factor G [Desulfuromonadales bacterium]|nr:elongation factor G [Desulfuromonadales bacterium]
MKQPQSDLLRNIGIISHIDAGKTTVSERILYYTNEIHKMGEVHDGLATMDWMDQEQERGITITATCTSCQWRDHWINLVDTPGHIDFTIEVERSMRVLDGAVAIFSAVEGVQPQSESVWRQADRYGVPRICLINKMDRIGSNYRRVLEQIQTRLNGRPVLLQLPIGLDAGFIGVVDILAGQALMFDDAKLGRIVNYQDVPEEFRDELKRARETVIETVADFDEQLMADYLDEKPVSQTAIRAALRKGVLAGALSPVLLGSALRNKGIQPLLDAVCDYLPSPLERPEIIAHRRDDGTEVHLAPIPEEPFCALAFKVVADEGRKLTFLRIYSGHLQAGDLVANGNSGNIEKVSRLFRMHAHKRERLQQAEAGAIVALSGVKEVLTGDCLCDPENILQLSGMQVPEPVINLAVEAKDVQSKERLLPSLEKLQWEDPTFRVREESETGQILLAGMGELHLDVMIQRLAREFGVNVTTGRPQVVYRESLKKSVRHRELFEREFEGKSQFADLELCLTPLARGAGRKIVVPRDGELVSINPLWLDGLEQSLMLGSDIGAGLGYPLTDLEIRVVAIDNSSGRTTEAGLKAAAQKGLQEATRKGGMILLEPVMRLEITVPSENAGQVLGGLQQKRGRIEGMHSLAGVEVIAALTPLSELFGYMTELRSATKGRGTFVMEFSQFDAAPDEVLQRYGLL